MDVPSDQSLSLEVDSAFAPGLRTINGRPGNRRLVGATCSFVKKSAIPKDTRDRLNEP
jgi:hypothetical protein